jgi:hypothetical protein
MFISQVLMLRPFVALNTHSGRCKCLLLDNMRQFVREEPRAALRVGRIVSRTENYIAPRRVGIGVHSSRRLLGSGVGMHTHTGKVLAKALLHVLPHDWLQRPAWFGKGLIYARRSRVHLPIRLF